MKVQPPSLDSGSIAVQFFVVRRSRPIAFRELRINDQIRFPQIRLFDDTTQEALGIVDLEQAKKLAVERELDLVEVAPMAQPPVCRLMDYGRYKFEAIKREKDSRREHNVINVKEMKLRPKISEHDFQTKFGYVKHFLQDGDKVKLTIMFRGREMVHQEYGRKLLDRMAEELRDLAIIERNPLVEGRNMIMILSPTTKKPARPIKGENGRRLNEPETDQAAVAIAASEAEAPQPAAPAAPQAKPATTKGQTDKETAAEATAPQPKDKKHAKDSKP